MILDADSWSCSASVRRAFSSFRNSLRNRTRLYALVGLAVVGGLYAIYLFYLGVGPLMKTPGDKIIPYMVVSAIVVIAVMFLTGIVAAAMTGMARY